MSDVERLHQPARLRPPNRREGETIKLEVDGVKALATINQHQGAPIELFMSGHSPGSQIDFILRDVSVVISLALQHGIKPEILSKSLTRLPHPKEEGKFIPASIVAAAIDQLCREQENPDETLASSRPS